MSPSRLGICHKLKELKKSGWTVILTDLDFSQIKPGQNHHTRSNFHLEVRRVTPGCSIYCKGKVTQDSTNLDLNVAHSAQTRHSRYTTEGTAQYCDRLQPR